MAASFGTPVQAIQGLQLEDSTQVVLVPQTAGMTKRMDVLPEGIGARPMKRLFSQECGEADFTNWLAQAKRRIWTRTLRFPISVCACAREREGIVQRSSARVWRRD